MSNECPEELFQNHIKLKDEINRYRVWLHSISEIKKGHKVKDLGEVFTMVDNSWISLFWRTWNGLDSGRQQIIRIREQYKYIHLFVQMINDRPREQKENPQQQAPLLTPTFLADLDSLKKYVGNSKTGIQNFMNHPDYERDSQIYSNAYVIVNNTIPEIEELIKRIAEP